MPKVSQEYSEGRRRQIIEASFDFDYRRSLDLFTAAGESDDPMQALTDLLDFLFQGLKGAASLGAGRANVQGWGEALVNPSLLGTIRRVLDSYLGAVSKVIRKAQALGQIDSSIDAGSLSRLLLSLYQGLELQRALDEDLDMDGYAVAAKTLLRSVSRQT